MPDGRSPISTRETGSNPEGKVENRPESAVTSAAVVFACCRVMRFAFPRPRSCFERSLLDEFSVEKAE